MAISTSRRGTALPKATLGRKRPQKYTYDRRLLEAVPLVARRGGSDPRLWVSDNCLRFTSLCPVTNQPDWASIYVNYVPDRLLIESKSLKEYLGSFRMHGDFHEDVCRIICDDLAACIAPRYLEVVGCFDARGSIAIWPYVQFAAIGDGEMQRLREYRFLNYAPGAYAAKPG